jgi:hypothetical protein
MSNGTIIAAIAFAVLGVALVVWVNAASPARLAARTAKRVGLRLPESPLRAQIERRVRHTRRWIGNCGAAGLILTLGGLLVATATESIADPLSSIAWLALAGLVLGAAVGALLGVLTDQPRLDPAQPRVAHAQHTTLRDYLDPIELVGARIVTALAVATGVATALSFVVSPETSTAITGSQLALAALALPVVAALSLLVLEVGGRRVILTRPRPAASPEALIWDDALRADDLRILATAPLMTGLYGFILGLPSIYSLLPPQNLGGEFVLMLLVNVGMYVLFIGLLVVLAFAIARKPEQFYLRRLWPEVAAAREQPEQREQNTP